ncbi:tRNA (adenosine(37)-N6)-threonylcarbamoyltransferase complex dimerization subunit type 1 TsaB [Desulfosediminicola ganghwensis]|uniref:tRNA (adenosine(37)-N6)-threonylcarbamoyltransferase complex dimerization subunit type 1 TsaB n=1 Tax=Desulfosediminicola ganghwensis TaxID=2569540 RepID=UPI001E57C867|nr:tRNA (adenosine(37)-N6)-threonylcarbamoyltransferase complex dimerization subunit type 1 TsaB [Desulfosediminicola ganghwensis]
MKQVVESDGCILAVDTATSCSTVALTLGTRANGRVLGSVSLSSNVTHSRRLLGAIDRLLSESGCSKNDISGYAVGLGPGSFTGLRIGMATVKGLAAAADKPLYGVSTLDILAANCHDPRQICAVLDARKKEVYARFYRMKDNTTPEAVTEIAAYSPETLAEVINEPTLMVGDGLAVYRDFWLEKLGETISIAPSQLWSPSASSLGLIAGELAEQGQVLEIGSAIPMYVRASDAELNLQMKKKGTK